MKNTTALLLFIISFATITLAQDKIKEISTDNTALSHFTNAKYRLFKTEINWQFIKLNTSSGVIQQVKVDITNNNSSEEYINTLPLVDKAEEVNGRFTLISTMNIYTFILLDQIDGRMWQVYWSLEPEERGIIQIN